jgi:uncharacterized membrane protein
MIDQFRDLAALKDTLDYFDWHFVVCLLVSIMMTLIIYFSGAPDRSGIRTIRVLLEDFSSMATFTLFGFATAYFLSQGVSSGTDSTQNKILGEFVAPFISLLSGGIAYFQIKTGNSRDRIVAGVSSFLLVCLISYQTFYFQKTTLRDEIKMDARDR